MARVNRQRGFYDLRVQTSDHYYELPMRWQSFQLSLTRGGRCRVDRRLNRIIETSAQQ